MEAPKGASGAGDGRGGVAGTDTQRMLFHVPDGASGTFARSVAAEVAVGSAVDEAVAVADGNPDTNADEASAGLAAGKDDGEPLAVPPTQPAATNAVSATTALHLRQPQPLTNLDCTAWPSERSSIPECVCDASLEARVMRDRKSTRLNSSHANISYAA